MQITEKVLCYQIGHWSWTDLWRHLNQHINAFFDQQRVREDLQPRFLDRFEPRLISMIENFEYRGITFEALLRRSLKLHLSTIYGEAKREKLEFAYCAVANADATEGSRMPEIAETPVAPLTGSHPGPGIACLGRRRFEALPPADRRLLVSAFKNCLHLDDGLCAELSSRYGLPLDWILDCRDQLAATMDDRLKLKCELRQKLNQLRIDHEYARGATGFREQERQQRRELRMSRLRRRLDSLSVSPRHQDIARILGIPKGSVDSSLYYVRQQVGPD